MMVASSDVIHLRSVLAERQDPGSAFLIGLTDRELRRSRVLVTGSCDDPEEPPLPELISSMPESVQEHLFAIWLEEEDAFDDPEVENLNFRDWLAYLVDDKNNRLHFHARYALFSYEPQLDLGA